MKRLLIIAFIICAIVDSSHSADLYQVWIGSERDAEILRQTDVTAVVRVSNGYLILADDYSVGQLSALGLKTTHLETGVATDNLAVDIAHDDANVGKYPVLYEEGKLRLYRVTPDILMRSGIETQLSGVPSTGLPIVYRRVSAYNPRAVAGVMGLDSLIGLISRDSLESYSERLQAFNGRLADTDSNRASSAWIKEKFESFGYDSVMFDPFETVKNNVKYSCRNVICTKPGSVHPQWTIVVGAHLDAVAGSPGADDNGSGTAGVIEIARILADIETDVTFKFMLFDFEEGGLHGSWLAANRAAAAGEPILFMLNLDMIAAIQNDNDATIHHGDELAYSYLWQDLADSLVNINGILFGSSAYSDHYPFQQNGYAVTFIIEWEFSSYYHTPRDSTTYLNYDYMTRLVKASLATAYTANLLPPAVNITSVVDSGDGHSLRVGWTPMNPDRIDHFWLFYYPSFDPGDLDSVIVPGAQSGYTISGLIEDVEYAIYLLPYDTDDRTSIEYHSAYGTPHSIPSILQGLTAKTVVEAIELTWNKNPELDIAHYRVRRDAILLPVLISDTVYLDDDTELGCDLHTYQVFAADIDGHISETAGEAQVISKAAQLEAHRILAVNRSTGRNTYMVDEAETGEFLHEALAGFDFDYYSDIDYLASDKPDTLNFYDLIDYELIILGGESAPLDDFGGTDGILDTLQEYMALGGKVILFGRWGWLNFEATLDYDSAATDFEYNTLFDISSRTLTLTSSSGSELTADLIGAHGQVAGYPDLVWDSMATVGHSAPYTDVSGIPCVSYPTLPASGIEILYTYNSSDDGGAAEGRPIVWRPDETGGQYVCFDLPLSFMERTGAVTALSRAVAEFGFPSATTMPEPDTVDVAAEEGEVVDIILGNLVGSRTAGDINILSLLINETVTPVTAEILPSYPNFEGGVCRMEVSSAELAASYGQISGTVDQNYTVSWQFAGDPALLTAIGTIVVRGYREGDANGDGVVNVGDAVYVINYVFRNGAAPSPIETGDGNGDCSVNVGDAVYLINFVFKDGNPPIINGDCVWPRY